MLLRSYIKPVLTFQAIEADRITATASYTVACDTSIANSTIGGKMLYTMEISRYTDMRTCLSNAFQTTASTKRMNSLQKWKSPQRDISPHGNIMRWARNPCGFYLPDEFEKVYEWGF